MTLQSISSVSISISFLNDEIPDCHIRVIAADIRSDPGGYRGRGTSIEPLETFNATANH